MGTSSQRYAVLMGDLVGSERAPDIAFVHAGFNKVVDRQNQEDAALLASPLTITLGDEFQGLAMSLAGAFSMARKVRFRLLADAIACRFAIGLVELKTPLNPDKAWNMMGSGLARTRQKLEEKRAPSAYRFVLGDEPLIESNLEALGAGLSAIERRWTAQQRDDIGALMAGATPAEIAKQRNVSVHSVYKVRNSGDFDTYLIQWQAIHEALAYLDTRYELS